MNMPDAEMCVLSCVIRIQESPVQNCGMQTVILCATMLIDRSQLTLSQW